MGLHTQAVTTGQAAPRPIFDPGVLRRLGARGLIVLVYVLGAVPAGLLRGRADNIGFPVNRHFNALESVVFWDGPSHWLQALFVDARPLQYLAVWIYASWFFLPLIATMPLMAGPARRYWRLVGFLLLTYYAGMPFFVLFPLAPPWMHDPGVQHVLALVNPGVASKDDNPFAAMPSLHVALPAAAALWFGLRNGWGRVLLGYSALIACTVMFTGDHYPADIAAGYALAAVVLLATRALRLPLLDDAADGEPAGRQSGAPGEL